MNMVDQIRKDTIYIDIPTSSTRSMSPLSSSSPGGRDKNHGFFHNLYKKFSLKSSDDLHTSSNCDEDSRSSSMESCSSFNEERLKSNTKVANRMRRASEFIKSCENSGNYEISSSSDSVSTSSKDCGMIHNSRRSSVRKIFENLTLNTVRSRSLSMSHAAGNSIMTDIVKPMKKSPSKTTKPPPKKILRRPVSYTYIRGISGLNTQRVPRSSICCGTVYSR